MKKLKLPLQNFEGVEVLTKAQLKMVMGEVFSIRVNWAIPVVF